MYHHSYNPRHIVGNAAVFSSLRGVDGVVPVDPTVNSKHYIPHIRSLSKLPTSSSDYNDKKGVSIQITQVKGFVLHMVYASDVMSAICAKNPLDKIAYVDRPVTQFFKSIDVKAANAMVETITPIYLNYVIYNIYYHSYERFVKKYLGGSSEYDDFNQKYTGFQGASFNVNDVSKNIIKPSFRWLLPIACSLLTNPEKFKFALSLQSPLEFTLNPNSIRSFTSRSNNDFTPDEFQGNVDIWLESSSPIEFENFFSKLPYLWSEQNKNYFYTDMYNELSEKKFSSTQDFKMTIKLGPTVEHNVWVSDYTYNSNNTFFGIDIKSAAQNFIASHITPKPKNSTFSTFDISTGLFANGEKVLGAWSIDGHDPNGYSFLLKHQKNQTTTYTITIKCTSKLNSFGSMYFDLGTFNLVSSNLMPQLVYFKSFTLDIRPYDHTDLSFKNSYDQHSTYMDSDLLVNGYFTFNPDNNKVNQHALWGITDVEKQDGCSDELYDICLSSPVPNGTYIVHSFALKRFVRINKPFYGYYDLDGKHKIEVYEITWEKASGTTEIFDSVNLLLCDDLINCKYNEKIFPTTRISIHLKDKEFNSTYGYNDTSEDSFTHFTLRLQPIDLFFDGSLITDIHKEKQLLNYQFQVHSYQTMLRLLKYSDEGYILSVGLSDKAELSAHLLNEVYIPNNLHEVVENDEFSRGRASGGGRKLRQMQDHVSSKNSLLGANKYMGNFGSGQAYATGNFGPGFLS